METYIAMLRGINVSGQKKIKMADLKRYMEELSFQDVETYIQSGNIVFKAEDSASDVAEAIKAKILERYGFEVPTIIKKNEDFEYVLANCPFLDNPTKEESRFYITFLDREPEYERIMKLEKSDYSPEEYVLDETNIFFYSPNGYGNAKMNNNFFENKLKVTATTRNWKTVHKLAEMSRDKS